MQTKDLEEPMMDKSLNAGIAPSEQTELVQFNNFVVSNSPARYFITEFVGTLIATILLDGVLYHSAIEKTPPGPWDYLYISIGAGCSYMIALIIAPDAQLNPTFTLAVAMLDGKPWNLVPGIWLNQLIASVLGHAMYYNSAAMFKKEQYEQGWASSHCDDISVAQFGILMPNDAVSNGLALWNTVLFNIILIWVLVPAFANSSIKNHAVTAMMIGLIIFAWVICTNPFAPQNNPAGWFGAFIFMWMIDCPTHVFYGHYYFYWIPLIGPYISVVFGVMGLIVYWCLIYHEPREWGKVLKMYLGNCPAIFTILFAASVFITYELVVHYNSEWNIVPSPSPTFDPIHIPTIRPLRDLMSGV